MQIFSKGFNFSQDGPGNRLVYHIRGCNMHCIWCSNPEGMHIDDSPHISPEEIAEECVGSKMMFFGGGGVTFTGGGVTFTGGGVTFTGGEATLCHNELMPADVMNRFCAQGNVTLVECY